MNEQPETITKLCKSRRYIWIKNENGWMEAQPVYTTPMAQLVRELIAAADSRGMSLSRYQANGSQATYTTKITWAAHTGPRPRYSRDLPADAITATLDRPEGTTPRCTAYRALSAMLDKLTARDQETQP